MMAKMGHVTQARNNTASTIQAKLLICDNYSNFKGSHTDTDTGKIWSLCCPRMKTSAQIFFPWNYIMGIQKLAHKGCKHEIRIFIVINGSLFSWGLLELSHFAVFWNACVFWNIFRTGGCYRNSAGFIDGSKLRRREDFQSMERWRIKDGGDALIVFRR
jgi:hypothetical protein